MAIPTCTISPPPPPLLSVSNPKPPPISLPLSLSVVTPLLPKGTVHVRKIKQRNTQIWRILAATEDVLPADTTPLESSQQIVSTTGDDGFGTIIAVLLSVAFVALSVLTIGVIYLGVTDFLQKRETEKLQKEEESKKKGRKKKQVRSRAGPRGFGQKIDEEDDFDD